MMKCTREAVFENYCDICGETLVFDDMIHVEIQREFDTKRFDFHKECLKDTKVLDLLCPSISQKG